MVSTSLVFGVCYVLTLIFFAVTGNLPAEIILGIPGIMYITIRLKQFFG